MIHGHTQVLRVWATRPEAQNEEWCRTLREQGFDVCDVPLLDITAVSDSVAVQAVKNLILVFDEYQKVIFVSQNAVAEAFRWLHDFWPQLPSGIEYFAVGKKTAECVLKEGVAVVACKQAMSTEELLSMPGLQAVKDQKILIFRGVGGLPRLGEILEHRGSLVRYCELYQRSLPDKAVEAVGKLLNILCDRDVVAVFSGETLHNFVSALDANGYSGRDMQLLVPGERVAQLARSYGFIRVDVAENASSDEMLQSIVNLRGPDSPKE